MYVLVIFTAFLLDWLLGDPHSWPHPVRFIGRLINFLEKKLRGSNQLAPSVLKFRGILLVSLVLLIVFLTVLFSIIIASKISDWALIILIIYLIYSALCLKDLYYQTLRVEKHLEIGDFEKARTYLSWIVGRDTMRLDEKGMRRAVIETLSENFSDGLVGPLFYLSFFGVFGLWLYKVINTLDSMVAYKNEKYLYFGRAAAYLDDWANYIPARLSAFLLMFSAFILQYDYRNSFRVWLKDHRKHSSPNSGHPESVVAGALDIYIGGNSYYGGEVVEKPVINEAGGEAESKHIYMAEKIVILAGILMLIFTSITILSISSFISIKYFWGF